MTSDSQSHILGFSKKISEHTLFQYQGKLSVVQHTSGMVGEVMVLSLGAHPPSDSTMGVCFISKYNKF